MHQAAAPSRSHPQGTQGNGGTLVETVRCLFACFGQITNGPGGGGGETAD